MAYGLETAVDDMLGSITDPIIVAPGGWMDEMPSWLRHEVEMGRMVLVMKASKENKRPDMATDAEAMIYIGSASHLGPMPYQWVNIYLWLGNKVLGNRQMKDIRKYAPKTLNSDQQRMLDDLKRWIWNRRQLARKSR